MSPAQILSSYVTEIHFNNILPSANRITRLSVSFRLFHKRTLCICLHPTFHMPSTWGAQWPGRHGDQYFMVVPDIRGILLWNLCRVILLRSILLRWLIGFWKRFCISALTFLLLYLKTIKL
jgi:hypothetical protein